MLDILRRSRSPISITYTPAHSGSTTIPALANHFADVVASKSQSSPLPPPFAPLPTFHMDSYVLYSPSHSYIESNVLSHINSALISQQHTDRSFRPSTTLLLPLHANACPPDHPYVHSSSAYSTVVQLYARSSQLDTRLSRFLRFGDCTPWCSFGCPVFEDAHHLFVHCPTFQSIRETCSTQIISETKMILSHSNMLSQIELDDFIHRATFLLDDNDVWPTGFSKYYVSLLPPERVTNASKTVDASRIRSRIHGNWHTMLIRLAGRIWGEYKRRTRESGRTRSDKTLELALPSHLSYIH